MKRANDDHFDDTHLELRSRRTRTNSKTLRHDQGRTGGFGDITAKISTELSRIFRSADGRKRMLDRGADPVGSSAEEFTAYIANDTRKWAKVIKAANIQAPQT